jgi:hypothetical protein
MLMKFENPTNGRFFYMFSHFDENGNPQLTIVRGGKNSKRIENFTFNDYARLHKEFERRANKRLKRGYLLMNEFNQRHNQSSLREGNTHYPLNDCRL